MSTNCSVHLEASILTLHATAPASPIALHATIPEDDQKYPLVIECAKCGTNGTYEVPTYLVGAVVILYHASHEGHALRFTFREHKIESPTFQQQLERKIEQKKEEDQQVLDLIAIQIQRDKELRGIK